MKAISALLLAVVSAVILYALFMDTPVQSGYGRMHNVGLEADRQLLMIFGCFLALVGVILFAAHKLSQRLGPNTPKWKLAKLRWNL